LTKTTVGGDWSAVEFLVVIGVALVAVLSIIALICLVLVAMNEKAESQSGPGLLVGLSRRGLLGNSVLSSIPSRFVTSE